VPDPVLTLLKYVVLAVLYLFFLRVLRAVWVELREPKVAEPLPVEALEVAEEAPLVPAGAPGGAWPAAPWPVPAPPAAGVAHLRVLEPPERAGQRFDLGAETTLGRAPGCAISLPEDTFVSQLHTRVFRRDGELWVEDLGSTNGTFLDGTKVTAPVRIHPGNRLQVGNTVLECAE